MAVLKIIFLLFVSSVLAEEDVCSKVKTIQRVASSVSGRWYLIAAKKPKMMNKANMKLRMETCGGFSNSMPCACSGFDISSTFPEPLITEYNATGFSFNRTSMKHDFQSYNMQLADEKSNLAIFNIVPEGSAEKNVIRGLATDDHKSFMLLYLCNEAGEETDIWFLSKAPRASDEAILEGKKTLDSNNLRFSDMFMVTQDNCVYPTLDMMVTTSTPDMTTVTNNNRYMLKVF